MNTTVLPNSPRAEYRDLVGVDGGRGVISDTDGGIDWLNFAAIAGQLEIDLRGGEEFLVDGVVWGRLGGFNSFERVVAGDGDDVLTGNGWANTLLGMRGEDVIKGLAGKDRLEGGSGIDMLFGGNGRDRLFGDVGNDDLKGGKGNDLLDGGAGWDTLTGGNGRDRLFGKNGNDTITGGNGNDLIEGGYGSDKLWGNKGRDIFVFSFGIFDGASDRIFDFNASEDTLRLDFTFPGDVSVTLRENDTVVSDGSHEIVLLGVQLTASEITIEFV